MKTYLANSSKGEIKIQQMAFVLVALMIFFAMVAVLYFSISLGSVRQDAQSLQDEAAAELVRKISSSSEFAFTVKDCSNCIDLDKLLILKDRNSYKEFWSLDLLQVRKIYPITEEIECEKSNYPDCSTITIIENEEIRSPSRAFVSLCRWESSEEGYHKCELGEILASGNGIK